MSDIGSLLNVSSDVHRGSAATGYGGVWDDCPPQHSTNFAASNKDHTAAYLAQDTRSAPLKQWQNLYIASL